MPRPPATPLRSVLPRLLVLLLLVGLGLGATGCGSSKEDEEDSRPRVADFTLKTHLGGEVHLSEALKKGPVILDFWATWCGPCRLAMPIYADLAEKYADQGLQFLPVSLDVEKAQPKIAPFFEKQGWTFPSLLDPEQKVASKLQVMSLPTMFLIDRDRHIVATHVGYRPSMKTELEEEVRTMLESGR